MRCARCHELIEPGEKWQLDHRDDGHGWLGGSHARCNGRAGWQKMVEQNAGGGPLEERPYKWSRRWHEEPPVGTEVMLGGGLVEVHVGGGVWQTTEVLELGP